MKLKTVGYVVRCVSNDGCIDIMQGLEFPENAPTEGVLTCCGRNVSPTLFRSRKEARNAITRTHHYSRLWYAPDSDDTPLMRIDPLKEDSSHA